MGDTFAIASYLFTMNLVNSDNILFIFIALIIAFFLLGFLLGLCIASCHRDPPLRKLPVPAGAIKNLKPAVPPPPDIPQPTDNPVNAHHHKHKHSRHSHHRHHNVHSL